MMLGNKYRKRVLSSDRTDNLIAGSSSDRLSGLDELLAQCAGKTILDLGCHDGAVSAAFADHGASRIDGCDLSKKSIEKANLRFESKKITANFYLCDLSRGEKALDKLALLPRYDLVLYLGMHHHLIRQMSPRKYRKFAEAIAQRTHTTLAVRAPHAHHQSLTDIFTTSGGLIPKGDIIFHARRSDEEQEVGPLQLFSAP